MGLDFCKKIVSYFGGEMTVTSEYGSGSTFSFTFGITEFSMEKNDEYQSNDIALFKDIFKNTANKGSH